MEPRLQHRIQRYGWDAAASHYEALWRAQLAPAHDEVINCAGLRTGEHVLDVACGTGVVSFEAAARADPGGHVVGVDLSERMVAIASARAQREGWVNVSFQRASAEEIPLADQTFDVILCVLGLMYVPEPELAIREMRRLLRPGGRLVLAVWGERSRCGWSEVFPIVDREVTSDVCPLFFHLGRGESLATLCTDADFVIDKSVRLSRPLNYVDREAACDAVLVGGPVALAWSRLDESARTRVRGQYLDSIAPWRKDESYQIPAEIVIVAASRPDETLAPRDRLSSHPGETRLLRG